MAQDTEKDKLREYRIERFEELRFTRKEAERLADSKEASGFDLNHRTVKRALDKGCSHKTAMKIFAD